MKVVEFEPGRYVREDGLVKNCNMIRRKPNCIYDKWFDGTGNGNTYRQFNATRVHRIVAKAFILNPKNKPFVNHINGKKNDNRVENLEWCTQSENMRHAFNTNLIKIKSGKDHHAFGKGGKDGFNTKVTMEDCNEIKILIIENKLSLQEIANKFNVSRPLVSSIKNLNHWSTRHDKEIKK